MGDFESKKFGASVTLDSEEMLPGYLEQYGHDALVETLNVMIENDLNALVKRDVAYYSDLTSKRDSFIHTVNATIRENENS